MSSDGSPNGGSGEGNPRGRRSSITQAAFSNLFGRGGSVPNGSSFPPQPASDNQRRRLSVTTLGLSGSAPNNQPPFSMRRGSLSTNSDSIDESAIEDDDGNAAGNKTTPSTPFVRRMSFGGPAMRGYRPGGSPGNGNSPTLPPTQLGRKPSGHNSQQTRPRGPSVSAALSAVAGRRGSVVQPPASLSQASNTKNTRAPSDTPTPRADQQGFNWSDQLKSRAENSVAAGPRPSFSLGSSSPPRVSPHHDRARSVSDMPQPPVQAAVKPKPDRPKPDAFQERILKGDFYMD